MFVYLLIRYPIVPFFFWKKFQFLPISCYKKVALYSAQFTFCFNTPFFFLDKRYDIRAIKQLKSRSVLAKTKTIMES